MYARKDGNYTLSAEVGGKKMTPQSNDTKQYVDNLVRVGMADYKIATAPKILTTLGLGSCVGISLYDSKRKIAGMAHIMLPDSTEFANKANPAKYADLGIDLMIKDMITMGAVKRDLTAKIAGGAQMFAFSNNNAMLRVGQNNVEATKRVLQRNSIPIIAEETGENFGRTIEFYTETGELLIKAVGKPNKIV